MPILAFIVGNWRWLAGVALVAVAWGHGYVRGSGSEKANTKAAEARLATFEAQVAAKGEQARQQDVLKQEQDKKRQESANAELKSARDAAASANRGWVQLAQSRASGGYLPIPGPNASEPQRACVNRAEFERAMVELDAAGARIAAEGDSCAVTLNNAKAWAQARTQ